MNGEYSKTQSIQIKKQYNEFLKKWLSLNKLMQNGGEKRMDIYVVYNNLKDENKNQFGLKFRDVQYNTMEDSYELRQLELKQRFKKTKKNLEQWKKILKKALRNPLSFSITKDASSENQSQCSSTSYQKLYSSIKKEEEDENQYFNRSNDSFQIIKKEESDLEIEDKEIENKEINFANISSQNSDDFQFNQVLELKDEYLSQHSSQQNSKSFAEIKEKQNIQEFEEKQEEDEEQQFNFDSQQFEKEYIELDDEVRLEIQIAITEILSQLINDQKDNQQLQQFYMSIIESKGDFELVLVKKLRFSDAISESTFIELQSLTQFQSASPGVLLSCCVEGQKERFCTQSYQNKQEYFKANMNSQVQLMGYPEAVNLYIQQKL